MSHFRYGKGAFAKKALLAAESVSDVYKDIKIVDAPSYSSGIGEFTKEQRIAVVLAVSHITQV